MADQVLNWTSNDPRQSLLYNAWGVLYRFSTEQTNGKPITVSTYSVPLPIVRIDANFPFAAQTIWRATRQTREDKVVRLEWNPSGGLGRAILGRTTVPMADLVRNETPHSRYALRSSS